MEIESRLVTRPVYQRPHPAMDTLKFDELVIMWPDNLVTQ